jgi:hypothetical protein
MKNYLIDGWKITLGPFNLILSDPSKIISFKLQFDDETSANANSTNLEDSVSSFTYSEEQDALGSSNVQTTLGTMLTSKYKLMFYIDSTRENANLSNDPRSSSEELQGTGHIELMEADGMNWILNANDVPLKVIDVLFKIGKEEFDSIDEQYIIGQRNNPSTTMGGGRRKRSKKTRRRVRRN